MRKLLYACLCTLLWPWLATAATNTHSTDEISALRAELTALKQDYATQIARLEARLKQTEATLAEAKIPPPTPVAMPTISAAPPPTRASNLLNPDTSVVLIGNFAALSHDPNKYAVPGFSLPNAAGPGVRGFSLGESELTLSANIDDQFYGSMTTSLSVENDETSVDLEEAFVQTTALPYGLTVKGGRFFSRIGYLNELHAHADDFVDRPLAYRVFLNGTLGDDGLQVRWLAPLDQFLEVGAEAFRGDAFPAHGARGHGVGTYTAFAHIGSDLTDEWSYRAGGSYVHAEAAGRETGTLPDTFNGTTELAIADLIFKWAPNGNPVERNLKLQAEYIHRWESGDFNLLDYDGRQDGFYAQAVYQFRPRWRIGTRFDQLFADNTGAAVLGSALTTDNHDPRRYSLLLEFDNSEFSRLRLQYNADQASVRTDHQLFLNYVYSLGAHGAHQY